MASLTKFLAASFMMCSMSPDLGGGSGSAGAADANAAGEGRAVITHVTDPAMPGKLSVVVGDGWTGSQPALQCITPPNGPAGHPAHACLDANSEVVPLTVAKNDGNTLICEMPEGDFAVQAICAKGEEGWGEPVVVNRPRIQWLSRESAQPGEVVRAIGRNLVNLDLYLKAAADGPPVGFGGYLDSADTTIMVRKPNGEHAECRVLKKSAYDVHFALPEDLEDGQYAVYAHSGLGGQYGWSEPAPLQVASCEPWPEDVFQVTDFGATGMPVDRETGWHDDTEGIQKALDAARANGGGVVYFPAGNYYVTATLSIPPYTVLRGESRERSWVWFPDGIDHGVYGDQETPKSVEVGMRGMSDFTIENLSIHSVFTKILIAAPMSKDAARTYEDLDNARAENVTIRNCYVFHEPTYRYHHRKQDKLLQNSNLLDESWGMVATIALRGDNVSVTDSLVRGGGMGIALLACRYATVARNEIRIGRSANSVATREGGYPAQPVQEKFIFEDNRLWPETEFAHSGFWCHATSRNYYIARNDLQLGWNADAEGLLWHGWGPQQIYQVSAAGPDSVTISDKDDRVAANWECVVVKGRGLGQRRMIKAIDGDTLTLDAPWRIQPESGCMIAALYWPCHLGHIIVDNRLADTGAGIFGWGDCIDWIVDGNHMKRGGGVMFDVVSGQDRPWSGNYFIQVLNNTVEQGRFMGQYVSQNWTLGYSGTGFVRDHLRGAVGDLGFVMRGNLHRDDSTISFWDRVYGEKQDSHDGPFVDVGMVVEDNRFANCKMGISVGEGVSGVLRGNAFDNVDTPVRIREHSDVLRK